MAYGEPEILFCNHSFHNVMEGHRQQATAAVQQIGGNQLLNTPTEDVVEEIVDRYRLDIPTLRRNEANADQREGQVAVYDGYRSRDDAPVQVIGTIIDLDVPFTGDKDFFFIQPTSYDSMPPRAIISSGKLTLRISGRNLGPEGVRKALNDTLDSIEKYLGWQRAAADGFNNQLPDLVRNAVEARKKKLLANQSLVAGLGFNLKSRTDAPKTYVAPVTRKKVQIHRTPASAAPFKPEPVLDDGNYKAILDIVHSMTLVMERSPKAFKDMGEEDLRQHFLVQLNAQYEGAATGETFNYQGKTDILIRVEGRNIFIAECKFWTGEKAFGETIDQILDYLSWRDTKAAVILFNRNKDFSSVLVKIKEAAKVHPNYKRGPIVEGETRLRFIFGNPTDHSREIILTVMTFDVPT